MDSAATIFMAISLVFVIEGLAYALFPEQIKKMMAMAVNTPEQTLRFLGLGAASTGVLFIWFIKTL